MLKKWLIDNNNTFEVSRKLVNSDFFYDPFLLKDMDKAVKLIKKVLEDGGKIMIFGDYDCDGITSVAMLFQYLEALGGEVAWRLPTREEGYGLNKDVIEEIAAQNIELIITVDNGITALEEALLIKKKGIELIITDHHTPLEAGIPEATAVINPKRADCDYPFKDLAGCGVVLKLITALEMGDIQSVLEQYGELAALGTIGDIVPLLDENRHIVKAGLECIEYSENVGLYHLIKQSGLSEKTIDAQSVAFVLCPRINSAGRMSTPAKALELLLCENPEIAYAKAQELNELNSNRAETEKEILIEIEEALKKEPSVLNERLLILSGENWLCGVTGVICSKLVSRFGKPCVIISRDCDFKNNVLSDYAKGSFRGIDGFSVHEALEYCGDLLEKFGGHKNAGGFSLKFENIEAFKTQLLKFAAERRPHAPRLEIKADGVPDSDKITIENIEKFDELEPFGEGNRRPIFCLLNLPVTYKRPLKEGKYVSFNVCYGDGDLKILEFSRPYSDFWYNVGDTVDLALNFSVNDYNDKKEVSAKVVDMRLSGINQDRYFAAFDVYEKIKRREDVDEKLLPRIIPEDAHMKRTYDIIKKAITDKPRVLIEEVAQRAVLEGINYCALRIILDVFVEAGLIELDPINDTLKLNKTTVKADLSKSKILQNLKERKTLKI